MPNLDFIVEGSDDLELRLRAAPDDIEREIRDIISESAVMAYSFMKTYVPRSDYKSPTEPTIYGSIRMSPVEFAPGGAGGGGDYVAEVGPGPDAPEHLQYVMEDTIDWDNYKARGNFMRIQKAGEPPRYRPRRKGYQADTEWFDSAKLAALYHIGYRLQRLRIFEGRR